MISLTINGLPAVLKNGTSFKLTRENPYFANSGDYTLDVQLPLSGCPENQRIFGALHRPEMSRVPFVDRHLDFRLSAPPLDLTGKAIVTSVTAEEVKVQLVAGTSAVVLEGEDRYIDELELGEAYDNYFSYMGVTPTFYLCIDHIRRLADGGPGYVSPAYGGPEHTPFVNFPVWSETDDAAANERGLIYETFADGSAPVFHYTYPYQDDLWHIGAPDSYHFAVQPYLLELVRRVLAAIGYEVCRDDVAGTWMERIFVCNARSEIKVRRMLPHWTVREFLDEVQRFFGVCLMAEGTQVDIVRKADYYAGNPRPDGAEVVELFLVADDREVTLDEEGDSNDTSAANIDYDHETADPMLRLDNDVWANADVRTFPTESQMIRWINENLPEQKDRKPSRWLFVELENGRTFAFLRSGKDGQFYLAQVDCCPPLIRHGQQFGPDGRDIDISLRIVPARMDFKEIPYIRARHTPDGSVLWEVFENRISLPMPVTSGSRAGGKEEYSVNDEVNPDGDTVAAGEDKASVIEVALNTGDTWLAQFADADGQRVTHPLPVALGIAYVKQEDGFYLPVTGGGNRDQFRLTSTAPDTIATTALYSGHAIDTRCQHLIRFTDHGTFDPMAVYLIRGRRYACFKLEYTIDEQGVQPLKTGYFYEIGE